MKTNSDLSILVLSSDAYQPIIKIWDFYFQKNWKDCPYKAYTVCNKTKYESEKVECFETGVEYDEFANHFKPMVLHALNKIKTKYVLFMVEDQIIVNPVINENISQALNYMDKHDITKLRCLSMPEPDEPLIEEEGIITNKNFGFISLDNEYRCSLQSAIWNKERFIELLNVQEDYYSGWNLEVGQHFRDHSKQWKFMACRHGKGGDLLTRDLFEGQTDSPILQYVELIRWGLLDRIYVDFFRQMFKEDGVDINTSEYEKFGVFKKKEDLPL